MNSSSFFARRAGGNCFLRALYSSANRIHQIGRVQRRAGIQRDDIARRAGFVFQSAEQHGFGFGGIGHAQGLAGRICKP